MNLTRLPTLSVFLPRRVRAISRATRRDCPLLAQSYDATMNYGDIITIEPGKGGGKPCIRGLRITVSDVLEYLASCMTEKQIINDFPDPTAEDIRAYLAVTAEREQRLMSIPA